MTQRPQRVNMYDIDPGQPSSATAWAWMAMGASATLWAEVLGGWLLPLIGVAWSSHVCAIIANMLVIMYMAWRWGENRQPQNRDAPEGCDS